LSAWPVREFLRRAILDNAALKLVALLLSLTLFIVVHGDRDSSMSFALGVAYTEPEGRVMTSRPIDTVRVTVRGPWTRLRNFDPEQSHIKPLLVDLSTVSDGDDYVFPESSINVPAGLRVASINPPSVRVQFEERQTKVVAVKPDFEGQPARGYSLTDVMVTPSHVSVRGPKGIVSALTEVHTEPIKIEGVANGGEERVALEPTEPHITIVDRQTIDVRYRVVEEQAAVTLGPLRVEIRPAAGVSAAVPASATTDPPKVKVTLRGAKNLIDRIDQSEVVAYVTWHVEDARTSTTRPARVIVEGVPAGVAIEAEPRDVTLVPRR
jgi:YbbR domain-containing protein